MAAKRENFGSRWAVVFAMAGSAIGLGNIWRFPYIVGQNGGAVFILIYLLCVIFLSLPIFISETIIGRRTSANTFGAMETLAPGTKWKWLGLLSVVSSIIILSYYSVVGGWSIGYLFLSVKGFDQDVTSIFSRFSTNAWMPLLCHTVFLVATAVIVSGGIKNGIEKFNKVSLPLLFVLILLTAVYSIMLPDSREGVEYLLKPDFSKVNPRTFAYAMGQGFFSLSLGVGTILTYASYMKKDTDILKTGVGTAGFDMVFALIAGFAVMPAVFAAGNEPGTGPGLVFETLPYIFVKMGGGFPVISRIVSILFFLTIVIAALTSSISMFEVGTAYLVEEKKMDRRKAVVWIFAVIWLLGVLCSLSFCPLSEAKIFGLNIFSFCDTLSSNFLMTLGALLFVVFTGWKMDRKTVWEVFTNNGKIRFNCRIFGLVFFLIRYVAPVVILVIFLSSLFL